MTILLICDDIKLANTIRALLPEEEWQHVQSMSHASKAISELPTKLVICSINFQGGTAFELCTRFRLIDDNKLTPFIVIAENSDAKDRVQTFRVGGDDYIAPFDGEHLKAVIAHEIADYEAFKKLQTEKANASEMALEVMRSSSEMGNAIQFIERCHLFESFEVIAAELIKFCRDLSLKVVVGIYIGQQWTIESSSGKASGLETDLIKAVHEKGRFIDFGIRTQMNWPHIAVLVKNMPLREPEKYGRIKDLLPTLIASANVRIHGLYEAQRIQKQTELMARSIEKLQPSIENVIELMKNDNESHRNRLSTFLQELIVALPRLGLEDDQEDFFITRVEALISEADRMITDSVASQDTLKTTNQVLTTLLAKQREIEELIHHPIEIADEKASESEADLFELF